MNIIKNKIIHGSSVEEIKFFYYFQKIFPNAIHRYKFKNKINKNFEIDIYIPDLKIGIEYDGFFYHQKKEVKKREIIKNELLKDKKIDLIRIREIGLNLISENNFFHKPQNITSFKNCFFSILELIKEKYILQNNIFKSIQKIKNYHFEDDIDLIRIFHKKLKIKNSILTQNPKFVEEWHPTKNNDLKPEHITKGSAVKVWWVCKNNHEWLTDVNSRSKGFGCPYCSNRKVCKDNCLKKTNKKLSKEWNYEKNDLTPNDVVSGSSKKVWWKCEKEHEWKADVNSRNKGSGCPHCSKHSKRKPTLNDSLASENEELIKEWHPTKNKKNPSEVFASSRTEIAWWQCLKNENHVWKSKIHSRHQLKQGCPYCSGKKVSKENSLSNNRPDLCEQWHPIKNENLTPNDVTQNSGKRVWWKCNKCEHEFEANINNRNRSFGKCPSCKKK
jgi:hypothetical protein